MMVQGGHRLGVLAGTTRLHFGLHSAADRQGFVLVPVPMRDTPEQMARHLDDAQVDVLITGEEHGALAQQIRGQRPTLMLNADSEAVSHLDGGLEPPSEDPGTYAILRTSGTGDGPSLVRIPRAALAAHREAAKRRLGCDEESTWLATLPLWHIGGVAMVDRCLHGGGRLVLQEGYDAEATAKALQSHAITHVSLVPTMLARLLGHGGPPSTLRCALIGGDRLDPGLARKALDAGWPLHASYGLTEACSQVTTATPDELRAHPGTSGQALDGVRVRIMDGDDECPPGHVGEIVVEGPTLAVPGPLRTGDLGHLDEGGRLQVVGRSDDRIITGGENVDPAAVEAVLSSHPDVREAAVVGIPDKEWGQRVVALIVPEAGEPDLEPLARQRLAAHERPKEYRFADSLPRTGAGKLRRGAVRAGW